MVSAEAWAVDVPVGYAVGGWRVDGRIATGSWGSVYAAHWAGTSTMDTDATMETGAPEHVALKFLPTGTVTPRQLGYLRDMADRELRFHQRRAHRRLIRAFQTLVVEDRENPDLDGCVVIVMERAERSLDELIRQHQGRPVPGAARLVQEICEGLAHMHAQGWIHGDLKPANVLLMPDGSVRLGDFGLTAELEGTHGYRPPVGTSAYLPPEYWTENLGDRGLAVRPTSDIWALGVVAYQLFTGQYPFPGAGQRAWALAVQQYAETGTALPVPQDVPEPWRTFIRDCLAPNHTERRRFDAGSLLQRIQGVAVPLQPSLSRRTKILVGGAVALVVLIAAGYFGTSALFSANDPKPTASPSEYGLDQLRGGVGIPPQYRQLIIDAGTSCLAPGLSPALIAAMLKTESNFDPNLSDPVHNEYGIARWTPSVLAPYMPDHQEGTIPNPPFPPEVSIPAVARYLCYMGAKLTGVKGDPGLLLAAAYRTSASSVIAAGGISDKVKTYISQVEQYRTMYTPA
jgi:serine/threonine protein kinase